MEDRVTREINEILQKMGLNIRTQMPRWRYWRWRKDKRKDRYAYGYTTEKSSDGKFYAFIYRINEKKGTWVVTKKVAFGRRKKAKERALQWYNKRCQKLRKGES